MIIKDPALRRYIYVIAAAAIAILVLFGLVADDETQVWLNLVAAILGLPVAGLAIPNTPKTVTPSAPEAPGVTNIYTDLTPGEHVIQTEIPSIDVSKISEPYIGKRDPVNYPHDGRELDPNTTSEEYHDKMWQARNQTSGEEPPRTS